MTTEEQMDNQLPPRAIAFIIDNEVVEVIRTNDIIAAIFLNNPKIVETTHLDQMANPPSIGWVYNEEENTLIGRDMDNEMVSVPLDPALFVPVKNLNYRV
jgi:hypothetical protein